MDGYNIVFHDDPDPIILKNSEAFVITSSITLSLCYASVMTAMLIYIIRHRNHPLLKLAQAPLSAVQMMCAILATAWFFRVFAVLNDRICRSQGMLIHVTLTILAVTLVGRL
jgi:hypothetical protein